MADVLWNQICSRSTGSWTWPACFWSPAAGPERWDGRTGPGPQTGRRAGRSSEVRCSISARTWGAPLTWWGSSLCCCASVSFLKQTERQRQGSWKRRRHLAIITHGIIAITHTHRGIWGWSGQLYVVYSQVGTPFSPVSVRKDDHWTAPTSASPSSNLRAAYVHFPELLEGSINHNVAVVRPEHGGHVHLQGAKVSVLNEANETMSHFLLILCAYLALPLVHHSDHAGADGVALRLHAAATTTLLFGATEHATPSLRRWTGALKRFRAAFLHLPPAQVWPSADVEKWEAEIGTCITADLFVCCYLYWLMRFIFSTAGERHFLFSDSLSWIIHSRESVDLCVGSDVSQKSFLNPVTFGTVLKDSRDQGRFSRQNLSFNFLTPELYFFFGL